jgi:hypothetical protein
MIIVTRVPFGNAMLEPTESCYSEQPEPDCQYQQLEAKSLHTSREPVPELGPAAESAVPGA